MTLTVVVRWLLSGTTQTLEGRSLVQDHANCSPLAELTLPFRFFRAQTCGEIKDTGLGFVLSRWRRHPGLLASSGRGLLAVVPPGPFPSPCLFSHIVSHDPALSH